MTESEHPAGPKFQYKEDSFDTDIYGISFESQMRMLTADGWDLVHLSTWPPEHHHAPMRVKLFLKRLCPHERKYDTVGGRMCCDICLDDLGPAPEKDGDDGIA